MTPVCIALPAERGSSERRVALAPAAVRELATEGRRVLVEAGAGARAGFADEQYEAAGAQLAVDPAELYGGRRCHRQPRASGTG